jgi:hypothetical protein
VVSRWLVVNPRGVGQPKDDDPRAAYAVRTDGAASLHRTAYSLAQSVGALSGLALEPQVVRSLSEVLRTVGRPRPHEIFDPTGARSRLSVTSSCPGSPDQSA